MKYKLFILIYLSFLVLFVNPIFSSSIFYDISLELKYINSSIEESLLKGDWENMRLAKRAITNLEEIVNPLPRSKEKSYTYLAMAYLNIKMTKSILMNQIDFSSSSKDESKNPVQTVEHYFNLAINSSKNMSNNDFGNIHFFVGIGYDFLRGKVNDLFTTYSLSLYTKTKAHLNKAKELGSVLTKNENIFSKIDSITDNTPDTIYGSDKLNELLYLFIPGQSKKQLSKVQDVRSGKIEGKIIENENFVDYKWRFSISKVSGWQFNISNIKDGARVSLIKEETKGVKPSINISALDIPEEKNTETLEQLSSNNLKNLEQIGYKIERKNTIDFKSYEAVEAFLVLKPVESPENKKGNVPLINFPSTKQYVLIIINNDIQYIITAISTSEKFEEYFEEFKTIINTFSLL